MSPLFCRTLSEHAVWRPLLSANHTLGLSPLSSVCLAPRLRLVPLLETVRCSKRLLPVPLLSNSRGFSFRSTAYTEMSLPSKIQAVGINKTGDFDVIEKFELPFPQNQPGNVLIKVRRSRGRAGTPSLGLLLRSVDSHDFGLSTVAHGRMPMRAYRSTMQA